MHAMQQNRQKLITPFPIPGENTHWNHDEYTSLFPCFTGVFGAAGVAGAVFSSPMDF